MTTILIAAIFSGVLALRFNVLVLIPIVWVFSIYFIFCIAVALVLHPATVPSLVTSFVFTGLAASLSYTSICAVVFFVRAINSDRNEQKLKAKKMRKTRKTVKTGKMERPGTAVTAGKTIPPAFAQFLLRLLIKPSHCEGAIGDIDEQFRRDISNYGITRARRLYWAETIRTIWPLVVPALKRLAKYGAAVWLGRKLS